MSKYSTAGYGGSVSLTIGGFIVMMVVACVRPTPMTELEFEQGMRECFDYQERVYGEEVVDQYVNEIFENCQQQVWDGR